MNDRGVSLIDLALVGYLCLQCFLGWRRGFLWQVAGMASIGFGMLIGILCAPFLAKHLMSHVTSEPFRARTIAFLFIIGSVGIVFRLLAAWAEVSADRGVSKKEREERRAQDRILGSGLGAVKGLLVAMIVSAACVAFFPNSTVWKRSHLAGNMAQAGSILLPDGAVREVGAWAKAQITTLQQSMNKPEGE